MQRNFIPLFLLPACLFMAAEAGAAGTAPAPHQDTIPSIYLQLSGTASFMDAAVTSAQSFNALLMKETYRNRIAAFNNPASSGMGFSLEHEIQSALKPLLAKAKNTDASRFSQVVSTLMNTQHPPVAAIKSSVGLLTPVFPSLLGMVGHLAVQEKRISREDLDSFIHVSSRYFRQFEKLHEVNVEFDKEMERLGQKLRELLFDLKEYMCDLAILLHPATQRTVLRSISYEELMLQYFDDTRLRKMTVALHGSVKFPSDAVKGAKDIASSIQKIFTDYLRVYETNYQQVRSILSAAPALGKNINLKQVENSVSELDHLYRESRSSDVNSMRLATLAERLKILVAAEQSR